MLKKRLLTAALLIPFVVAAILFLPTNIVNILLLAVSTLAGIEWLHITGRKNVSLITVMIAGLLLAGGGCMVLSARRANINTSGSNMVVCLVTGDTVRA